MAGKKKSGGKAATSGRGRSKPLGLTPATVKDVPPEARRSRTVKGGAKRKWTAGNDQPPN
jgi:hypothetical protein